MPQKFASLVWVFASLTVVYHSGNALGQACLQHKTTDPSVPECAGPGQHVLSGAYPAMAVTISDESGGTKWVKNFVKAVVAAEPDKPPQFIINGSNETMRQVSAMIKAMQISDEKKKLYLSALTQAPSKRGYNWQQDFMQPVVDESGQPTVRPNLNYLRGIDARSAVLNALNDTCKLERGNGYAKGLDKEYEGTFGGNLSGGPNGSCVVGTDHFQGVDWFRVSSEICGKGAKIVQAPTSFLGVGHTDEIFSAIRTGPGRCDIAVLLASPAAAFDSLKKSGGDRALPLTASYAKNVIKERKSTVHPRVIEDYYSALCDAIDRQSDAFDPANRRGRTINKLEPAELKRILFRSFLGQADAQASFDVPPTTRCLSSLAGLTNENLVAVVKADPNLLAVNNEIQRQMDEFKDKIRKELSGDGCPAPKIADVGAVFLGKAKLGGAGKNTDVQGALGIFPNLPNLQQFGNTLLVPDPGNAALKKDFESQVKALGPNLKVTFLDTQHAHLAEGNLHCSTNAVRYCRPAGSEGMIRIIVSTFTFLITSQSSLASETPNFQKLKSGSSTVLSCKFDFNSERTGENFSGQIRLTSVGEVFAVIRRDHEPSNECNYGLRSMSSGAETVGNKLRIDSLRNKACQPVLSAGMRRRLDESMTIDISGSRSSEAQPPAQISVIYLEGNRPCAVTSWNAKAFAALETRLASTNSYLERPPVLPEPLDTSDAMRAVQSKIQK